jgi:hypothetical protein
MAIDDSYTVSLLHFDGADASTVFTDESSKTWTKYNHAQIDTAQSKFGGASGLFDGTDDYIDTPDSADFDVGSGNFTAECWLKLNTTGVTHRVFGQCDSGASNASLGVWFSVGSDQKVTCGFYSSTTGYNITATTAIPNTNWHHLAQIRNGNTMYLALDGTFDTTTKDVTGITANNSASKFAIGRMGEYSAEYFNGWIDEFRFSKGIARWTANFTPPTAGYAYPTGGSQAVWFMERTKTLWDSIGGIYRPRELGIQI